ncbi:MAG: hypothetical protein ACJZ4F_04965 [Candidatus Thalassarchaeaceae archaeon]
MDPSISGLCLRCKKYGLISNVHFIVMKNGRTRAAGLCSEKNCSGKISKIIS